MNTPNYEIDKRTALSAHTMAQRNIAVIESSQDRTVQTDSIAVNQHHGMSKAKTLHRSGCDDLHSASSARVIKRVGILGMSSHTVELALDILDADIPVTIFEVHRETLDEGLALIRQGCENVVTNTTAKDASNRRMALIAGTLNFHHLKDCDLIIEYVVADLAVKRDLFLKLDQIAKRGAILGLNATIPELNLIANHTKRRGEALGLHLATHGDILEIVRTDETSPEVVAAVASWAEKIHKQVLINSSADHSAVERPGSTYFLNRSLLTERSDSCWRITEALE